MQSESLLSWRLALCLLFPALWVLLFLFGLPLTWVLLSSLGVGESGQVFGFGQWVDVLLDPVKRLGLGMSLYYSVTPVLLATPIAVALAALLQQRIMGHDMLMTLFRLPIAAPGVVAAFVVMLLLDQGGFVSRLLGAEMPRLVRDSWGMGVVLATAAREVPFMALIITTSLAGLPEELLQAARSLGAGPWRTAWHVQLPLVWPGISAAMVLAFIKQIGAYAVPHLIGPVFPLPLSVLMVEAYQQGRWGEVCAIGMVLSLFAVGVLLIYQTFTRRMMSDRWQVLV